METRINPMRNEVGSKWAKYIISSNKVITDSALPKAVMFIGQPRRGPNG